MPSKQLNNDPSVDTTPDFITKTVPLTEILADQAKNSRRFGSDPKSIQALAGDIAVRGQLFPLLVRERSAEETSNGNGGCPYELVDGFRRYDAMTVGNIPTAVVRVMPTMDALEAYKISIAANNPNLRREPSLMDTAYQIAELEAKGMARKDIVTELKIGMSTLHYIARFTGLRPEIQKRIHTGEIPWTVARNLPGMEEAEQDRVLAEIAAAGKGSATEIAEKNKKRKSAKRPKKDDEGGGKRPVSAKAAVRAFEAIAADPEPNPETGKALKETKAEENLRLIMGIVGKFMAGRLGEQAMANQIRKLL
jgi:ParB-like chromosome segregation protein Spo0J